jgi:hypothetical protein
MDEKPTLDYRSFANQTPNRTPGVRIGCGILAALVTLLAGLFFAAGIADISIGGAPTGIILGLFFTAVAYLLWRLVGAKLWPHKKRKNAPEIESD